MRQTRSAAKETGPPTPRPQGQRRQLRRPYVPPPLQGRQPPVGEEDESTQTQPLPEQGENPGTLEGDNQTMPTQDTQGDHAQEESMGENSQPVSEDANQTQSPSVTQSANAQCEECGGDMIIGEHVRVHVEQGPDGPQVTGCGRQGPDQGYSHPDPPPPYNTPCEQYPQQAYYQPQPSYAQWAHATYMPFILPQHFWEDLLASRKKPSFTIVVVNLNPRKKNCIPHARATVAGLSGEPLQPSAVRLIYAWSETGNIVGRRKNSVSANLMVEVPLRWEEVISGPEYLAIRSQQQFSEFCISREQARAASLRQRIVSQFSSPEVDMDLVTHSNTNLIYSQVPTVGGNTRCIHYNERTEILLHHQHEANAHEVPPTPPELQPNPG